MPTGHIDLGYDRLDQVPPAEPAGVSQQAHAPAVPPAPPAVDVSALELLIDADPQASGLTPLYRRFEQDILGIDMSLTAGSFRSLGA